MTLPPGGTSADLASRPGPAGRFHARVDRGRSVVPQHDLGIGAPAGKRYDPGPADGSAIDGSSRRVLQLLQVGVGHLQGFGYGEEEGSDPIRDVDRLVIGPSYGAIGSRPGRLDASEIALFVEAAEKDRERLENDRGERAAIEPSLVDSLRHHVGDQAGRRGLARRTCLGVREVGGPAAVLRPA